MYFRCHKCDGELKMEILGKVMLSFECNECDNTLVYTERYDSARELMDEVIETFEENYDQGELDPEDDLFSSSQKIYYNLLVMREFMENDHELPYM